MASTMTTNTRKDESIVYVVDDDDSLREALSHLMEVVGLKVECFATAQDFLKKKLPDVASCLVLDVRMPVVSGLNLQDDLAKAGVHIPIIFMTAHGDIPMTVQAMKAGAVEFLVKPFRDQDMLDAVQLAIERDRARREQDKFLAELRAKFASLTQRERQVIELVATGRMNKQVAAEMGIAEITVKIYRGKAVRKMGARSVAELVKMAQALGISTGKA
jgi:FixJ family two-component response regulator